jgi:putative ABC transport system permease protein
MLAENMVLTVVGGTAGILLAYFVIRILAGSSAIDVPRLQDATLDGSVVLFTGGVCAITAVLLGFIPALRSSAGVGDHLRASAGTTPGSSVRRWHGALVVGEVALAMIPLTGAGLMLRSLWQVQSEGAVLAPRQVLMARIQGSSTPGSPAPSDALRQSDRLVEEIEAVPGVRAAAVWSVTFGYPARISGLRQRDDETVAMWFNVSPHFGAASGVRLLAGRWFTDRDRVASPPVVVVSERFVRTFSADVPDFQAVVGRTTFGPFPPPGSSDRDGPMTIIGVVSDFRSGRFGILRPDDANGLPQVFYPDVLRPITTGELLVRTASSPLGFVEPVRDVVHRRPGSRLMTIRTLDDQLSAAVAPRTFNTRLIVVFAAIALLLTVVGVSGVLRYSVAQRTHEIGVRLALGARRAHIARMILSYAVGLVAAGVAIGLTGSAVLSRTLGGVLYGVTPTDRSTYAAITVLLVAVSLIAAYLPARRAMRLDPMAALHRD